jgi:hypothetical protein
MWRAKEKRWLKRAVRGEGPFAERLVHDFMNTVTDPATRGIGESFTVIVKSTTQEYVTEVGKRSAE